MTDTSGRSAAEKTLRHAFRGALLADGDTGYDAARAIWNAMHDRRPALIAQCRDAADVSAAVRYAAAAGLGVTVRGGGHNVAGTAVADGAVMIDLSRLRDVDVDPVAATADAGGGCLLRDLDAATLAHGLACPSGVVSHTGLGGLALGGGYGWLARKWGLTCDHLISAEVVLADGSVVRASADEHPDLYWALRGGGGNLGIVTRFRLRLRPVGPVHQHTGVWPLAQAAQALQAYREFAVAQPADLHTVGALKIAGRQEWVPAEVRGAPALFLTAAWFGDPASGPAHTNPLFERVPPAAEVRQTMSYATLQALGDHSEPHGNRYFTKSCYLSELTSGAIAQLLGAAADVRSSRSSIDFEYLRGAIAETPDDATAFPRRDAPYICTVSAQWTDVAEDAGNIEWTRESVDRLRDWQHGGAYVNYLQDEPPGKVREVYGESRYARLSALKDRYDPTDLLTGNRNVSTTVATFQ